MKINDFLDKAPTKFREAYAVALCGPGVGRGKFRHGAVLVSGPVTVASGFNQYKTHPKLATVSEYPFLHAESHVLLRCGLNNTDDQMKLYVLRVKRDGTVGLSEPCEVCKQLLAEAGIDTVYWSTEDGYASAHIKEDGTYDLLSYTLFSGD